MSRFNAATLGGWAVKGLGGTINILGELTDDGVQVDGDQLKDLRMFAQQAVDLYNHHAKRSSLTESERPPLFEAPTNESSEPAAPATEPSEPNASQTG